MRQWFMCVLMGSVLLCSSLVFAQNESSPLPGPGTLPMLSKDDQVQTLKLFIEMMLFYKMLGQPALVATDGGVMVLFGNKISKYDKDLNLVKEVKLNLDLHSTQEMASAVAEDYAKQVVKMAAGMFPGGGSGDYPSSTSSYKSSSSPYKSETRTSMPLAGSQEAMAKATLRQMSTAAEAFASANAGNYPAHVDDLIKATPSFLDKNYCDQEKSGYTYSCDFHTTGYKIVATPTKTAEEGAVSYTISTGGILEP